MLLLERGVPESKPTSDGLRVAETLKDLRRAANLTQEKLAARVNLTLAGYRPYERGQRTLTVKQIRTFAEAFGVAPETLADRLGLSIGHTPRAYALSADLEILQQQLAELPDETAAQVLDMWRRSVEIIRQAQKAREN